MSGSITANTCPTELPDDVATLRGMVVTLLADADEQARRIVDLEHQLESLRRRLFGRRSEKIDPHQLALFQDLLRQVQDLRDAAPAETPRKTAAPAPRAKPTGRKPLPEHLPVQRTERRPEPDELVCAIHGRPKVRIGEEVTEELEFIPASFYRHQIVRGKFACPVCEGNISIADLPARPIDKGLAGPGVLAHVLTSKYADHLPLNRLEGIFARYGLDIHRSTLCQWVAQCSDRLSPIVGYLKTQVLASKKIHTDDTPVPVLDEARRQTRKGYLWAYIGDRGDVVFDYTPNRGREGPVEFLKGFQGYLQADAYNGYDAVFQDAAIVEVGCWAHARRKFHDAFETDRTRCAEMLEYIRRLYDVEREAKEQNLDADGRFRLRREKSKPVLAQIQTTLEAWSVAVLPKSPVGQAVAYTRKQWDALMRFLEDGILEIDNNLAERTLRMVAVGRKNWMFAGSDEGGKRAAIIYSLVASCKQIGLDPFAYLRDVLDRISTHPHSRLAELSPRTWKPTPPSP